MDIRQADTITQEIGERIFNGRYQNKFIQNGLVLNEFV